MQQVLGHAGPFQHGAHEDKAGNGDQDRVLDCSGRPVSAPDPLNDLEKDREIEHIEPDSESAEPDGNPAKRERDGKPGEQHQRQGEKHVRPYEFVHVIVKSFKHRLPRCPPGDCRFFFVHFHSGR